MINTKEKVKLSKEQLKSDIGNGFTRPEIAKKYNLSVGQIKKALEMTGLDKMRASSVKFEIVDDICETNSEIVYGDRN
jgi:hypothetical protein